MSVDRIGEELPCVVAEGSVDTDEQLLLWVARGDHEALVALHCRMAGLVRINVLRVLGDASRSDAVTQEVFADVPLAAQEFDPDRQSAQAWLLTRTHERALHELASGHVAAVLSP